VPLFSSSKYINKLIEKVVPAHKPDFIIVGAQKAGTSSLFYYLSQHPKLSASQRKEVAFFNRDENFKKGVRWYQNAFKDPHKFIGSYLHFESTPAYLYHSHVAERIFNYSPQIKIIAVLREPVERAFSAWNMYRDFSTKDSLPKRLQTSRINGTESSFLKEFYSSETFPDFEACVESELTKIKENSEIEEPSFIRRGIYYPQVKRYFDLFGKQNVLIIGFRDLFSNQKNTLNSILSFLGLPESDWNFLPDTKKKCENLS
jgi:hypothetical protein